MKDTLKGLCLAWLLLPLTSSISPLSAQEWHDVTLHREITHPQPMTGLVLWPEQAKSKNATYGKTIQLEFAYCLPCKIVTGCLEDGTIQYDWSSFETLLNQVKSRKHQLVVRFRYEYPSGKDVDGQKGTTAVPAYIKARDDYHETYSANPGGDGPTYYADWSNAELQRFTLQFYTDFAERYAHDPRIAFLEVGFGHWSEYHIYGTQLELGTNFPSKDYQKKFFRHLNSVMDGLPWLVSIDAGDDYYSPIATTSTMTSMRFGLFDDSFMHEEHEIADGDGWNEKLWNAIGKGNRWKRGVCGGEISYYKSSDQKNFLNPAGMYGHTWEEAASKYHITFMIANDAPGSTYGTASRFREASMATGYRLAVKQCQTDGQNTRLLVTNEGIAPLYRDAFFAIGDVRSEQTLKGLLPGKNLEVTINAVPETDGNNIKVVSDCILPSQEIEFDADLEAADAIKTPMQSSLEAKYYNLAGQEIAGPSKGITICRNEHSVRKVLSSQD